MASNTYLSKQTTVNRALGILRGRLDEISIDRVQSLPLMDYINIAQQEVALLLSQAKLPDYGQSLVVKNSASGAGEVELAALSGNLTYATADLSADYATNKLRISRINRVTFCLKGTTIELPTVEVRPAEFDNIHYLNQKNKEVYWYFFGETLYIRNRKETIAAESDWGFLTVYYDRFPVKLTADSDDRLGDTLDVKDGFVDLVINKAKLANYEELQLTPPEALSNDINNAITGIKNSIYEENQFIDGISKKSLS